MSTEPVPAIVAVEDDAGVRFWLRAFPEKERDGIRAVRVYLSGGRRKEISFLLAADDTDIDCLAEVLAWVAGVPSTHSPDE